MYVCMYICYICIVGAAYRSQALSFIWYMYIYIYITFMYINIYIYIHIYTCRTAYKIRLSAAAAAAGVLPKLLGRCRRHELLAGMGFSVLLIHQQHWLNLNSDEDKMRFLLQLLPAGTCAAATAQK